MTEEVEVDLVVAVDSVTEEGVVGEEVASEVEVSSQRVSKLGFAFCQSTCPHI